MKAESHHKKVFVGLSGGVDSSVSAYLLKKEGYDVTGVFIKVWEAPFLPCTWREERRDAMRVAAHLGIPLITLDLGEEYKREVVDYFLDEYRFGRTPNPDVMCNKVVKFGAFLDFAKKKGADFIATGHYARRVDTSLGAELHEGIDAEKDQSYFLWTLTQDALQYTLFPIGNLHKNEVRAIATDVGLPTATKKDSQGICFLGMIEMNDFLSHYIPHKEGVVLDIFGKVIGKHDGAVFHTIGSRHGFTIQDRQKNIQKDPLYVLSKDIHNNTITVGSRNLSKIKSNENNFVEVYVSSWHWISGTAPTSQMNVCARFRYHQVPINTIFDPTRLSVVLTDTTLTISEGQSLVLYEGDHCLGGGVITKVS